MAGAVRGRRAGGLSVFVFGPPPPQEVMGPDASPAGSFATTGDPGRPAYDTEQRLVRLLDTAPAVAAYPEEAARRLWQGHTFGVLPLTAA